MTAREYMNFVTDYRAVMIKHVFDKPISDTPAFIPVIGDTLCLLMARQIEAVSEDKSDELMDGHVDALVARIHHFREMFQMERKTEQNKMNEEFNRIIERGYKEEGGKDGKGS